MIKGLDVMETADSKKRFGERKKRFEIAMRKHPLVFLSIIFFLMPIALLVVLAIAVCIIDIPLWSFIQLF